MDSSLWELIEGGSEDDEVSVILRLEDPSRVPDGVRVVARFGNIVTARLQRGNVRKTWENDLVKSMKASRPVVAPLPFEEDFIPGGRSSSRPPARPNIPEDGTGVIVAVCDWGLDFTHPAFRKPDGSTRVLALWDQRGTGAPPPEPYRYGRVHTRADIDAALAQPDPFAVLGYDLNGGDRSNNGTHGTHVCDIAAGSPWAQSPGGIAPGADLVFVQLTSHRMDELSDFGDSVCLLEALDFVRNTAAGRPCVINLSAGKTGGEHRGTSPFERAVDNMLLMQDGLCLVQSVGNYANTAMHTHARLGPDQRHTLRWTIHGRDRTPNELEIWYSGQDVFEVAVVAPGGQRFSLPIGERVRMEHAGQHWGNLYHRRLEPNSGLNHIDLILRPAAPSGTWKIELRGREVVDGRLHAWIERDVGGFHQSRFAREQATSSYTTNTICNSLRAIAVGAYDASLPERPATRFSSRGPTADGRQKPELVAPGYRIRAARSMPSHGWQPGESQVTVKSGTSMASPHVAGTVALMYQAAGRPLTIGEVRRVLIGTADPHAGPPGRSSTRLGYGYLDIERAVAAVRGLGHDAAVTVPAPAVEDREWDAPHDEDSFEQDVRTATLPRDDDGDEGFGDEDELEDAFDGEGEPAEDPSPAAPHAATPAPAVASSPLRPATPWDGFSPVGEELAIDPEAAFRPRRWGGW